MVSVLVQKLSAFVIFVFFSEAAKSVTFDLLFIEIMFLIFKNMVKELKLGYTFYQLRKP